MHSIKKIGSSRDRGDGAFNALGWILHLCCRASSDGAVRLLSGLRLPTPLIFACEVDWGSVMKLARIFAGEGFCWRGETRAALAQTQLAGIMEGFLWSSVLR